MNQVATDTDLAVDVVASKLSTYAISSQWRYGPTALLVEWWLERGHQIDSGGTVL